MQTQNWKKTQEYTQCQLLRVSPLDTKHMESMVGSSILQDKKVEWNIWDGEICLYHIQKLILVEKEYGGMGKECLIKFCLLWGDVDMDPLVGQGIV